ncbi:MAG: hypothetical protein LJU34_04100, partial [Oscillospiraceae bacterium]|nr:hypothetical protein [Oscillospiraceae bacterium]
PAPPRFPPPPPPALCSAPPPPPPTVCTFPDGQGAVIAAGNPGMASGGTGDVLAGIIGGLMGQMTPRQAILTACWLHARAGDLAAAERGEYAVTASSILDWLPAAEQEIIQQ